MCVQRMSVDTSGSGRTCELLFDEGETGASKLLLWVLRGDTNLGMLELCIG